MLTVHMLTVDMCTVRYRTVQSGTVHMLTVNMSTVCTVADKVVGAWTSHPQNERPNVLGHVTFQMGSEVECLIRIVLRLRLRPIPLHATNVSGSD